MVETRESIGVVGLGYVGLPLALAFTRAGYEVVGVDIDETRVETLRAGDSYITDVSDDAVATALDEGFRPTTEYEELSTVEGVSVCVPTPLRKTGTPEMSYVADAVGRLAQIVPRNCTVVLESTVYPGATTEVVVPAFEDEGYHIGEDLFFGLLARANRPRQRRVRTTRDSQSDRRRNRRLW
jgi:UDP-N-acetyl-D-mannosaminuronate dehydrogenase